MVERTVRQLAQANENLTGNIHKLNGFESKLNKVKEQICMHEVESSVMRNE